MARLPMLVMLFGVTMTAAAGSRLGTKLDMFWEPAVFALGIILIVGAGGLQLRKRIEHLEKKISDLIFSVKCLT